MTGTNGAWEHFFELRFSTIVESRWPALVSFLRSLHFLLTKPLVNVCRTAWSTRHRLLFPFVELSLLLENVLFLGDLALFFPDVFHRFYDQDQQRRILTSWTYSFAAETDFYDENSLEILSLVKKKMKFTSLFADRLNRWLKSWIWSRNPLRFTIRIFTKLIPRYFPRMKVNGRRSRTGSFFSEKASRDRWQSASRKSADKEIKRESEEETR